MDSLRRPAFGRPDSLDSDAGHGGDLGSDFETGSHLAGDPQVARDRITVTLIEDNRLVREALIALLNRSPDIRVIGGDPEGHESMLRQLEPDVVLLDPGLENGDSLRIARKVLKDFPSARVIVMDLLPGYGELSEFVVSGVSGFILKDASLEVVVSTIRAVAAGLKVLPDEMAGSLLSKIARDPAANGGTHHQESVRMTPREREVIHLIAEGLSNKAIAERLHVSIHTVKSHLRNIMDKLTLNSRLQVAKYVHERAARAEPPVPERFPKDATPLAQPATGPLIGRIESRPGTDAPGRLSRSGAERRAFGSRGRSRRRSRPR